VRERKWGGVGRKEIVILTRKDEVQEKRKSQVKYYYEGCLLNRRDKRGKKQVRKILLSLGERTRTGYKRKEKR